MLAVKGGRGGGGGVLELSLQTSFLMCSSAHSTVHGGFLKSYWSVNVMFSEHYRCFTFPIILWFLCYSSCFVLYSNYSYSISNKKRNGHQAFESLGLLGAITFLFKQYIS